MPRVEIVQKHNTAARRLYIRGHNGKVSKTKDTDNCDVLITNLYNAHNHAKYILSMRSYGNVNRRVGILFVVDSFGRKYLQIYPYLVVNDACLTESRREERVLQLLRMLNHFLGKQKVSEQYFMLES